ncbi:preprotein translocase subunit YajC [Proteocatella sphenisci]|uniref:preprotein translocase subunit YajC n=1 Tax=Proteocatella sphenisci TaxID=181070 RepID=UPI00048F5452|nr:preprotein translocase subunit YajC [Proteocatella sphenisci]
MGAQQIVNLVIPVGFLAVFYFLLIRPQQKRDKSIKSMRETLKPGDDVVTIGGIVGKITKVTDESVTIEVGADKTRIIVEKWAIGKLLESK